MQKDIKIKSDLVFLRIIMNICNKFTEPLTCKITFFCKCPMSTSKFKWPLAIMWWWIAFWEMRHRVLGCHEGSLTRETGKQKNSYKVRVGAFSAISVLFESRWVMWSCCLSALLSLRHHSLLSFFLFLPLLHWIVNWGLLLEAKAFSLEIAANNSPK